jgi:hypothetical protein
MEEEDHRAKEKDKKKSRELSPRRRRPLSDGLLRRRRGEQGGRD